MTEYVLGFAFDCDRNILCVQKEKPAWQKGQWNGVGGAIEEFDDSPVAAMVREFEEEARIKTLEDEWAYVVTMEGDDWTVHVYTTNIHDQDFSYINGKKTDTEEMLRITKYPNLNPLCIDNLSWLIPMCIENPQYKVKTKE